MRRFVLLCAAALALFWCGAAYAEDALPLENADFSLIGEDGLPAGWYCEAWLDGEGEYSLSFENGTAHIINPVENDVRLCQGVAVEAGEYYRIACDVRQEGVAAGAGANVSVNGTFAISDSISGDGWQRISLTGQAAEDAESIAVCIRLGGYGATSSGEAWFKNLAVTHLDGPVEGAAEFYSASTQESTEDAAHNVNELHSGAMYLILLLAAAAAMYFYSKRILPAQKLNEERNDIYVLLAAAFIARCVLSLIFYGHSTDIACFMAWGNAIVENGPATFYTSGMFADYPPGYMYVLYITSGLAKLLGIGYGTDAYALLTKMPGILADVAAAYIIYRMGERRFGKAAATALACLVALNPAMAFLSGGWGQIDQVLSLLLIAVIYLYKADKIELAGLVYGAAIMVKPQALMAGPLLAAAYIADIKPGGARRMLRTLYAVAAALGCMLLISLPFKGAQPLFWFVGKLLNTATSYAYASIEAFNFMALLGGNWKPVTDGLLLLTYGQWGTIMIALSVAVSLYAYVRARKRPEALPLCMAFLLAAIFTFGQYMHERYIFPVLMLLLLAFVYCADRRLIAAFLCYTLSLLLNAMASFVIVKAPALRGAEHEALTVIGSLMSVGAFAYLAYASFQILIKKRVLPAFTDKPCEPLPEPADRTGSARFTRRDRLWCGLLTGIYAVVALVNLGSLKAPETSWQAAGGETARITFQSEADIAKIKVFGGIAEGSVAISAGGAAIAEYSQTFDDMFRWAEISAEAFSAGEVELSVTGGRVWLNELAFLDQNGDAIPFEADAAALCDEQDTIPARSLYFNGMYFDELYHGRTAYEHLHGMDPYENSHPPLGKVFIMLGVAVFGMCPFGWRIAGALFGAAMLPLMYIFAKKLFRSSEYALLSAGLLAVDFMHFTQTRIATVDVFGVFFIILMFYFMYRYYCLNFFDDGLKATLRPLAFAGIAFGFGAASKWICLYAGGGLAVVFFTSLISRFNEYQKYKNSSNAAQRGRVAQFPRYALLTLAWCCVFYLAVPAAIYVVSYLPYMLCEKGYGLSDVWGFQEFMYSYHSGLTASHPYESPWWQWPLDWRPVWYYISYDVPAGRSSTISALGNPAVWWVCSIGTAALAVRALLGRIKKEKGMFVLLVGAASSYLPWMLVTRCTFAYHYFAAVPFIILCTVYLVRELDERRPEYKNLKWGWLGLCAVLFMLFYPALSGTIAPTWYIRALEWLPAWTFLGY